MAKHFYFRGLGLLMEGVKFTPEQEQVLGFLCESAQKSDAIYWDRIHQLNDDPRIQPVIESLKDTFRSLDKEPILKEYYDREHQLYS